VHASAAERLAQGRVFFGRAGDANGVGTHTELPETISILPSSNVRRTTKSHGLSPPDSDRLVPVPHWSPAQR
jgi:hypothetical protein